MGTQPFIDDFTDNIARPKLTFRMQLRRMYVQCVQFRNTQQCRFGKMTMLNDFATLIARVNCIRNPDKSISILLCI